LIIETFNRDGQQS